MSEMTRDLMVSDLSDAELDSVAAGALINIVSPVTQVSIGVQLGLLGQLNLGGGNGGTQVLVQQILQAANVG